jgi:transposase-like protein
MLRNAVYDVLHNKTSVRKAAKDWGIPKTTLQRYLAELETESQHYVVSKRVREEDALPEAELLNEMPTLKKRIVGRPTVLSQQEEDVLVQQALSLAERNLPVTRHGKCDARGAERNAFEGFSDVGRRILAYPDGETSSFESQGGATSRLRSGAQFDRCGHESTSQMSGGSDGAAWILEIAWLHLECR